MRVMQDMEFGTFSFWNNLNFHFRLKIKKKLFFKSNCNTFLDADRFQLQMF